MEILLDDLTPVMAAALAAALRLRFPGHRFDVSARTSTDERRRILADDLTAAGKRTMVLWAQAWCAGYGAGGKVVG